MQNPLAEVFGYPIANNSTEAKRYRKLRLCPFNNKVPSCTKDKANDPLGVCSIFDDNSIAITCPIRFREHWLIAENAASFFFLKNTKWTSLTEVRMNDKHGRSAGNIDLVLVSYDKTGKILDFGALEVQAVYISGNIRKPFEYFMRHPGKAKTFDWNGQPNYPNADYLSSSRKRLAPQLIYKGGILKTWGKKTAVALHSNFFKTLPDLPEVSPEKADIAWMIYDLKENKSSGRLTLFHSKTIYTKFESALNRITISEAGNISEFMATLQEKLNEKLNNNPPDTHTLFDAMENQ